MINSCHILEPQISVFSRVIVCPLISDLPRLIALGGPVETIIVVYFTQYLSCLKSLIPLNHVDLLLVVKRQVQIHIDLNVATLVQEYFIYIWWFWF